MSESSGPPPPPLGNLIRQASANSAKRKQKEREASPSPHTDSPASVMPPPPPAPSALVRQLSRQSSLRRHNSLGKKSAPVKERKKVAIRVRGGSHRQYATVDCFEDTTAAELKELVREKLMLSASEEIAEFGRARYFADDSKTVGQVGLKDFQKLDLKITSKRKAAPPASSAATAPTASTAPVWEWFDTDTVQWKAYPDSADIERRMETKSKLFQVGARTYLLDFDNMTQTALVRMPGAGARFARSKFSRPIRRRVGPAPVVPRLTPLLKEMVRRGEVPYDQALQMMGYTHPAPKAPKTAAASAPSASAAAAEAEKPDEPVKEKKKKKKKKKKKFSYAKWMKKATTLKRSLSQEQRDFQDRIREGTGGGDFDKLDRI